MAARQSRFIPSWPLKSTETSELTTFYLAGDLKSQLKKIAWKDDMRTIVSKSIWVRVQGFMMADRGGDCSHTISENKEAQYVLAGTAPIRE